ncbi:ABC transporter ATP-binding protein [Agromyces intestinalis]|uniref:ABC transporter ATP-binding protein n=1 Tax=Agromyces intestinalis TaxID=2592652 RepID=A0A5C1YD20_9MICO|nr:ABC transporter ATP-binding protein [Agromyces intestinalis]QEO13916.1 ABC transporter ATP-binding protein [Agromyces intestinalis]
MIEARGLTKRYGDRLAVDDLTFTVRPGAVTGFLGPNGAGKSTTMRMILGLTRPTSGTVTIDGRRFADGAAPLAQAGALLDAKAVHPGRTAYHHLLALAATHGIPKRRVLEVIELTGLERVAAKRVGGFSLGMGQRLGIAGALLGDPRVLILDEPVNGLDPEGVRWVRRLARHYAAEGRTVFLSSHLMSEVAVTADQVIVIGRGRILADASVAEIVGNATATVRVRTPRAAELMRLLTRAGVTIASETSDTLEVTGIEPETIAAAAAGAGIVLTELTPLASTLEDAYMALTENAVEYRSHVRNGQEVPR